MSDQPTFGFGQTLASDYVPGESGDNDAVWIRSFKDGSTQIRIAPATGTNASGQVVHGFDAWPSEREHFDRANQLSYPCPKEHGASLCVGCESENAEVRKRGRTYYVNALDKDGRMRIYKFGITVYKILKGRQERLVAADPSNQQPLSDKDIVVTRSGKNFNEITYDIDWGEKYPINWAETTPHDINKALEDAYREAMAKYNGGAPLAKDTAEDAGDTNRNASGSFSAADAVASSRITPDATKDSTGAAADEGDDEDESGPLPDVPSEEQLDNAETTEIRRWLKDVAKAEFPERAPRARLLKLAKAELPKF
jgi:hypothetical protein